MRFITLLLTLTLLVSVSSAQEAFVTDGLVSFWTFDKSNIKGKTVEDIWSDNDGNIKGEPKSAEGHINEALEFDGVDDWIEVPLNDSLALTDAITTEAWAKFNELGDYEGIYGTGHCTVFAKRNNDKFHLEYHNGADWKYIWSTTVAKTDEWYHILATYDNGIGKMYVNGKLEEETDQKPESIRPVTTNLTIGHIFGWAVADWPCNGVIDELRIYNRALTESEVQKNFKATSRTAVKANGKLPLCWGKIKHL
jgi:hypothetical protein